MAQVDLNIWQQIAVFINTFLPDISSPAINMGIQSVVVVVAATVTPLLAMYLVAKVRAKNYDDAFYMALGIFIHWVVDVLLHTVIFLNAKLVNGGFQHVSYIKGHLMIYLAMMIFIAGMLHVRALSRGLHKAVFWIWLFVVLPCAFLVGMYL